MRIGIYGGSIRPGGGLTVLKQIVEAVAQNHGVEVFVYTGEQDCSDGLASSLSHLRNVEEVRFFPAINPEARYLVSKLYFINETRRKKLDVLISINYFIPAACKTIVYHLNLLSFMVGEKDSFGMKMKRLDARMACRYADINIFESKYLAKAAGQQTKINNSKVLYVGVDQQFECQHKTVGVNANSEENRDVVTISVVSSPSPHKDNTTCLSALSKLVIQRPNVNWRMVFVGGLSVESWSNVKAEASQLCLSEHVTFSGPMSKVKLSKLLRESLCLMNASLIESFCMVAVEAMASCCPVIVTDATSMPESVGDAGIVVAQRNSSEFVDSVLALYDNDELRNGYIEKGSKWSEKFSIQMFNKNICDVLGL